MLRPEKNDIFTLLSEFEAQAFVVAQRNCHVLSYCYGINRQVFDFASVTKPLIALGILSLADEGKISLEEQVLENGANLVDILAHCSGLAPDELAFLSASRTRRIYSNSGYREAFNFVSRKIGQSFSSFLDIFFSKLGFSTLEFDGDAAKGIKGEISDLYLFCKLLLLNKVPVSPLLMERAASSHCDNLKGAVPGVGHYEDNAWGIGFEVKKHKTNHWMPDEFSEKSYGHFGKSGAFFAVDPTNNIAIGGKLKELSADFKARFSELGSILINIVKEVEL